MVKSQANDQGLMIFLRPYLVALDSFLGFILQPMWDGIQNLKSSLIQEIFRPLYLI